MRTSPGRLSRRGFLRASGLAGGGLVLWISTPRPIFAQPAPGATPGAGASDEVAEQSGAPATAPAQQGGGGSGGRNIPKDLDAWLKIGRDGMITLSTGKVEFGQGIQTAFGQLVADELDVPFQSVQVIMGSTDQVPYDNPTVGSQSMRSTGPLVRQAAAEMRSWLLELGSVQLGAPPEALTTANGSVMVAGQPDQAVSFASLAAGKTSGRQMTGQAPLKTPDRFSIIGTDVPRVDVPAKVTGTMKYGYDTTVPGMLQGKIVRPPSVGATLQSVDFSQASGMPGVVAVYQDGGFAGLAAQTHDQAQAAIQTVRATWQELDASHTSDTVFDLLKTTPDQGRPSSRGDVQAAMAQITRPLSVTVRAPYVAHASIEPESALARPDGDRLEVWASTQAPFQLRDSIAHALSMPAENITVHAVMSGGAFGRKAVADAGIEAARLARGIGQPVRVNWTREEEFQLDQFRPAMLIELHTGLDAAGTVPAWTYDLYAAAYYQPMGPGPMSASANAGADATTIYGLNNIQTVFYQSQSPLPVHNWRANGAPVNALARETALDELAEMAGVDPVTFREGLLVDNPRMLAVMHAAVQKAGWTPSVGRSGQGMGLALDFADGTWVAEVAHVSIDPSSGTPRVEHIDVAVDCGLVVNPAGARAQVEGGVIGQGVSSTLKEAITFANGRITNDTFRQYGPLRMTEAPSVDVVFVEDKSQPMQGLGEPAVGPVSAAISNAIHDAIGVRLRDLPFTADRVQAALQAAGVG
jgi:nicotinate dehydrogenase subunit B